MWHCGTTRRRHEDKFEFVLPPPTLVWSTPLGLSGWCGGHMHQHSTSGIRRRRRRILRVTLHMLTHGTMWECGLTSLVVCIKWQISWYKGEKCDNKEWDLNYQHPSPRVLGYYRVCDIMRVDITEFRVYCNPLSWLGLAFAIYLIQFPHCTLKYMGLWEYPTRVVWCFRAILKPEIHKLSQ
jgi:hypothetical protein